METLILISLFILGTILGSGLNALAWRYEKGLSWGRGRSRCPHCGQILSWWELLPLLSFILLRRRCSQCHVHIDWQYPLVELAAGGLLVLSYITLGFSLGVIVTVIASIILLFIYIYDARTMLIPNAAVWSFNILAFISVFLNQRNSFTFMENIFVLPSWWAVAAGPLATLPLFLIWFLSRGKVMGFGDVKLTLGIGWLLGIAGGLSAVTYAFWVGAVVSLGILSAQRLWKRSSPEGSKSLTMKSAVPFGPFLILGWLIALFSGITLF